MSERTFFFKHGLSNYDSIQWPIFIFIEPDASKKKFFRRCEAQKLNFQFDICISKMKLNSTPHKSDFKHIL